jgi:hypothetical protein
VGVTAPGSLAAALALEPRPVVPLPGRWTFWADMLVGGQPLGNVDVSSFYCVRRLSNFGHGNVTVNLPCGIPGETLLRLWSWRLWAFYDGLPYFCGVPTGVADQDGSAHVQLTLTELPGYLAKRAVDWHPNRVYSQAEQTAIARDIAEPVADVGVVMIIEPGAGFRRDRTYEFLESDSRATLLTNLAGVLSGPEFRVEYRMRGDGRPECVLRIAYPQVGDDGAGLGITVPGSALSYRSQWDADELRTVTFAVGDLPQDAPDGTARPVAIERRPQPDLPRLDAVDDWPGTVLQTTLVERARAMATRQARPAVALTASPPEELPAITEYAPGDTVTIRAVTPLLPLGLEVAGRLDQIEVNAAAGVATWSIVGAPLDSRSSAAGPGQVTRETVAHRLDRLDSTVAGLFHSGQMAEVGTASDPTLGVQGRTFSGTWNATGTGWSRVSEFGPMRARPPVGAAVVIEAMGILEHRQNDLEVGLSWPGATGAGQVASARVEGITLPLALAMCASVTATVVVTASNQLRAHVSARAAPDYRQFGHRTGGNPDIVTELQLGPGNHSHAARANVSNNWTLEGDTGGTVPFDPAAQTSFNIVARFGAGGVGQQLGMRITRVTYYGGAAP